MGSITHRLLLPAGLAAALLMAVLAGAPALAAAQEATAQEATAGPAASASVAADARPEAKPKAKASSSHRAHRAVKKHRGKASYYSRHFYGRKMADGTRLDPRSNAAASRTLPLGTKARVKNLNNGKSAVVEIRDRGPYVKGRVLDVTPQTATELGARKKGVFLVEITPLELPPGEPGANEATR